MEGVQIVDLQHLEENISEDDIILVRHGGTDQYTEFSNVSDSAKNLLFSGFNIFAINVEVDEYSGQVIVDVEQKPEEVKRIYSERSGFVIANVTRINKPFQPYSSIICVYEETNEDNNFQVILRPLSSILGTTEDHGYFKINIVSNTLSYVFHDIQEDGSIIVEDN